MTAVVIETGTPEYVALKLLERVSSTAMDEKGGRSLTVTESLDLYSRCLGAVKQGSNR